MTLYLFGGLKKELIVELNLCPTVANLPGLCSRKKTAARERDIANVLFP
jgi:hypothetical protein